MLDTDNKPHKQKVKVGIRNGDDVQVTKGLKGGERVVTVGAFELDKLDEDVLPKTKIQVQAPKMPDEDEDEEPVTRPTNKRWRTSIFEREIQRPLPIHPANRP